MSDVLLTTKFQIPPAHPNLIERPRLFEQLDDGLSYPVMLVSAPAGFGKTTIISAWLHRIQNTERGVKNEGDLAGPSSIRVAWLSLTEEDNDENRFFTYLSKALDSWNPGLAETVLALLEAPQPPSTRTVVTILINALSQLPTGQAADYRPYVLVLDDYHLIHAAAIHDALTFLVDHGPVQLHIVLTSRVDPPLRLTAWRARGQMAEVRAADLRFTLAEAVQFLNVTMGLALSPEDVEALEDAH